jgi:hypothetical protein
MRQIIGRRVYDTETATLLHMWTNEHFTTDLRWRAKCLYRTPKGALFIHHQGGPMTDLARQSDGRMTGGEQIEPVSAEDAVAFLTLHDGANVVARHFANYVDEA